MTIKAILKGVIAETKDQKNQISNGFKNEFGSEVEILKTFRTAEDRADVLIGVPDEIIVKLAIHEWHIGGMLSWADDYADNNDINKAPEGIIEYIRG